MFVIPIRDVLNPGQGRGGSFWQEVKTWAGLYLIRYVFVVILIAFFVGLVFVSYSIAYPAVRNAINQGGAQTVGGEIKTAAESTGVWGFFNRAYTTLIRFRDQPLATISQSSWDAHVIKNPGDKVGIFIDEFKETRKYYRTNTEVTVRGKISKVTGEGENLEFDQETKVVIECQSPNYKGKILTELSQRSDETIQPNTPQYYTFPLGSKTLSVNCLLPEGFNLEGGKASRSAEVSLAVDYKFTTDATLTLYFIDEDSLALARGARMNPFDFYNINNKNDMTLDTAAGLTQFYNYPAPEAFVGGIYNQPFEQEETYFMEASLKNNALFTWKGNIHLLEDLFITLPDNFEVLEGQSDFVSTEDPRALPEPTDVSYQAYRLKQEKVDEFNNICKGISSDEECRNKYSEQPYFYKLVFKVADIPEIGGISKQIGGARAYYTYRTIQSQSIRIQDYENVNIA